MFVFNINKRFQLYGCYQTGPNTRKPLDFCIRANHHRQKEQRASVLASALPHVLPPWPSHQMVGRRKAVFHLASRAGRTSFVTAELCSSREQGAGQSQGPTQSCRGCSIPSSGHPTLCWVPACPPGAEPAAVVMGMCCAASAGKINDRVRASDGDGSCPITAKHSQYDVLRWPFHPGAEGATFLPFLPVSLFLFSPLISFFFFLFELCRKPSRPCATAPTCTAAGWCWSGQTRRRHWRPCAAKPPSTSTVSPALLPHCHSAGGCQLPVQPQRAGRARRQPGQAFV